MSGLIRTLMVVSCALGAMACHSPLETTAKAEVVQVQRFGDGKTLMDLEIRFECPGDARRIMRLDKETNARLGPIKAGDKLDVGVVSAWSSEKSAYRTNVTQIGNCPVRLDPKEEANYEMVQVCKELKASGVTVGVTCDRTRPPELLAACPYLRRK